jgi:hypothetical protein
MLFREIENLIPLEKPSEKSRMFILGGVWKQKTQIFLPITSWK